MAPVIPTSTNSISLASDVAFITKRSNFLSRCSTPRKLNKQALAVQKYALPLSTCIRLFPQFRIGCILKPKLRTHIASASGTEVALEEADLSTGDNDALVASTDAVETSEEPSAKSDASPVKAKRSRSVRKSEMPPVKNEELIPGATFAGKVRSIQPFGAFVDFGAFTDGLVHVSRLSDSFVKDVSNVVTVGQEVTVRLIEVNMETGRISLSMRESDGPSKLQQQRDAPVSSEKSRPPRKTNQKFNQKKEEIKKSSKFVKGQDLEGTVKNLTRAGAFISLPEGEEGFLPASEEADEGFGNIMGGSSLEVGQEVSVRVLRITRGQVTLTMKKEEDVGELDAKLKQGVVHTATNPFVLAFRSNQDISAFLDERESKNELVEKVGYVAKVTDAKVSITDDTSSKALDNEEDLETIPVNAETNNDVIGSIEEVGASSVILGDDGNLPIEDQITEEPSPIEAKENKEEAELSGNIADLSAKIVEHAKENAVNDPILKDEVQSQKSDTTIPSASQGDSELSGDPLLIEASEEKGEPKVSGELTDDNVEEVAVKTVDDAIAEHEFQTGKPDGSRPSVTQDEEETAVPNPEKNDGVESSSAQIDSVDLETKSSESLVSEEVSDNEVRASSVILVDDGNLPIEGQTTEEPSPIEAKENKEEAKLSGNIADPSARIVEHAKENTVNDPILKDEEQSQKSDTTIPSASQGDSELSGDPLQIEASEEKGEPKVSGEFTDDNVEEVAAKTVDDAIAENEVQTGKPDGSGPSVTQDEEETAVPNPEKNDSIESSSAKIDSVDLVTKSTESLVSEEVSDNQGNDVVVNEVEMQTSVDLQKNGNVSTPSGQNSDASPKETIMKASISPALVKQLREETGAGMMDCKKALSETGGDIVKAQEYLRKKGLASADKKASRATAEGRIGSYIHDSRIGVLIEVNCETDFVARGDIFRELVEDLAMQVAACPQVQYLNTEDVPKEIVDKEREIEMQKEDLLLKPEQIRSKIVDGRIRKRLEELALLDQPFIKDDKAVVKDWVKQTISTIGENVKVKRFVRYNLGEGLEKKSQDFAAEVAAQTAAKPISTSVREPAAAEAKETVEQPLKAVVSAALVKQLREETGAGMMDCKKALSETGGDLEKAQEYLRKKGLSTADKKSSRLAAEGRIGSYIHDSRIGVLIEVNCETDFVGRSKNFKELVDDLAMQVVACPQVEYASIEDIPESMVTKEKQLEMQREDLQSKPENIREKIVEGRVTKRLGELALLEQPFIKNDSILVKDLVKQTVAALGENIKVRRFVRFTLGETSNANLENET